MKVSEAEKLVAVMQSQWPNWKPLDDTGTLWAQALPDYSYEEASNALRTLIRGSEFAPSVAALIKRMDELRGDGAVTEGAELDALLKKISSVGSYGTPIGLSEVNKKIVRRLGGWKMLCAMDADEIRKQHHYLYADAAREVEVVARLEALKILQAETERTPDQLPAPDSTV